MCLATARYCGVEHEEAFEGPRVEAELIVGQRERGMALVGVLAARRIVAEVAAVEGGRACAAPCVL